MMTPKELAILAAKALDEKKGKEISAIEITDITTLADYFVIATGTSSTHVRSLADEVEEKLKAEEALQPRVEGYRSNSWILLDYGNVVVHVFTQEARDFYDLDRLWADGAKVDWQSEE